MRSETDVDSLYARLKDDGNIEFLVFYKEIATKDQAREFARQLLEMCGEEE